MDFTIHYAGQLSQPGYVYKIIEEIKDIAEIRKWPYTCLDEDWNKPPDAKLDSADGPGIQIRGHSGLKGIQFQPHPNCDTIWLYFNQDGYLTTPFQVALSADEGYPPPVRPLYVRTLAAGFESHILLINLFRYLKKKYIPNLRIIDETQFWDLGDKKSLEALFQKRFTSYPAEVTSEKDKLLDPALLEDIETIARKIEDLLRNIIEDSDPEN